MAYLAYALVLIAMLAGGIYLLTHGHWPAGGLCVGLFVVALHNMEYKAK